MTREDFIQAAKDRVMGEHMQYPKTKLQLKEDLMDARLNACEDWFIWELEKRGAFRYERKENDQTKV